MSTIAYSPQQHGFGDRLRQERERLGLTQQQLGAAGGVRRATQWQYERGSRTPTVEYLAGVSSVGVDFKFVLTGQRLPETGGKLCIDPAVLHRAFLLVDQLGRDAQGRVLDPQHRVALMLAVCRSVADVDAEAVDWDAIRRSLAG